MVADYYSLVNYAIIQVLKLNSFSAIDLLHAVQWPVSAGCFFCSQKELNRQCNFCVLQHVHVRAVCLSAIPPLPCLALLKIFFFLISLSCLFHSLLSLALSLNFSPFLLSLFSNQ